MGWLIYQLYQRFRGTQAERVMRGLIMIVPILFLCYIFKLTLITKLVEILSSTLLIGLIVIFAPEFRRVLMNIGSEMHLLNIIDLSASKKQINETIEEITESVKELQKSKTGALIVFERAKVDRYYVNPGVSINATISKELVLSIFSSKSPLHDGAITIRGTNISNAAVILPMTENPKLDWQYGTRHRAAIGFTEVSDSICIVVSEETGGLSLATGGKLQTYSSAEELSRQIDKFYAKLYQQKGKRKSLDKFFADVFKSKSKKSE